MYFEKATSYFSTSNPAFSQAYVLRVRPIFSPAETGFIALSFALSATIFFSATKKVKLRYFCSLALRIFNRVVIVRTSFFSN